MNQNILIIGATSAIAEAVARRYAEQGACLFLVARNTDKLQVISSDLSARGAKEVRTFVLDANDSEFIPIMLKEAWQAFGSINVALIAHGTLPDQHRTELEIPYAINEFRTNGESAIMYLAALAQRFESQSSGVIAVIGSGQIQ